MVCVGVRDLVPVAVRVPVGVGVGVAVGMGVAVGTPEEVRVTVLVRVGVGVTVGSGVLVGWGSVAVRTVVILQTKKKKTRRVHFCPVGNVINWEIVNWEPTHHKDKSPPAEFQQNKEISLENIQKKSTK